MHGREECSYVLIYGASKWAHSVYMRAKVEEWEKKTCVRMCDFAWVLHNADSVALAIFMVFRMKGDGTIQKCTITTMSSLFMLQPKI